MLDEPEFARWGEAAAEALDAARLQAGGGSAAWSCFLAEQAAQLAVKGLLRGAGEEAWGHDLVDLVARLQPGVADDVPREISAAAQRLSRHYIPTRYPDAHPSGPPGVHYSESDARAAIRDADMIRRYIGALWQELAG